VSTDSFVGQDVEHGILFHILFVRVVQPVLMPFLALFLPRVAAISWLLTLMASHREFSSLPTGGGQREDVPSGLSVSHRGPVLALKKNSSTITVRRLLVASHFDTTAVLLSSKRCVLLGCTPRRLLSLLRGCSS